MLETERPTDIFCKPPTPAETALIREGVPADEIRRAINQRREEGGFWEYFVEILKRNWGTNIPRLSGWTSGSIGSSKKSRGRLCKKLHFQCSYNLF